HGTALFHDLALTVPGNVAARRSEELHRDKGRERRRDRGERAHSEPHGGKLPPLRASLRIGALRAVRPLGAHDVLLRPPAVAQSRWNPARARSSAFGSRRSRAAWW